MGAKGGSLGLVVAVAVLAGPAASDDTNYQTYGIGQRALGMGSAFTALADNAGGEFYNPAGIAMLSERAFAVSQSLYSYQRREFSSVARTGVGEETKRVELSDSTVPTIPTAASYTTKFGNLVGGIKRYTIGYSIFVPYISDFSATAVAKIEGDPGETDDIRIDLRDSDRTLMHGPTFAMRLTPKWSLGVSVFHLYRTAETWSGGYRVAHRTQEDLTDFLLRTETRIGRIVHSLVFAIGARYDIHPNWQLGLALTSPSITVTGDGDVRSTTIAAHDGPECPPNCIRYREDDFSVDADSKRPFAMRFGVAFVNDSRTLTLATDISFHTRISYNPYDVDMDQLVPEDLARDLPAGFAIVDRIQRNPVVNVNVGGEYLFEHALVRAGFFTNFSSAPEIGRSLFAQPSRINMYGVSLSVGFRWKKGHLALGGLYSFGRGEVSTITPPPAGTPPEYRFGPRDEQRDFVYFFIEWAVELAKKRIKEAL